MTFVVDTVGLSRCFQVEHTTMRHCGEACMLTCMLTDAPVLLHTRTHRIATRPREELLVDLDVWTASGFPPAVATCVMACCKVRYTQASVALGLPRSTPPPPPLHDCCA
jgi:hypothetical protein